MTFTTGFRLASDGFTEGMLGMTHIAFTHTVVGPQVTYLMTLLATVPCGNRILENCAIRVFKQPKLMGVLAVGKFPDLLIMTFLAVAGSRMPAYDDVALRACKGVKFAFGCSMAFITSDTHNGVHTSFPGVDLFYRNIFFFMTGNAL
jgi:hypothetical protein